MDRNLKGAIKAVRGAVKDGGIGAAAAAARSGWAQGAARRSGNAVHVQVTARALSSIFRVLRGGGVGGCGGGVVSRRAARGARGRWGEGSLADREERDGVHSRAFFASDALARL